MESSSNTSGKAIVSLIMGILSIILFFVVGIIFGIVGLILSNKSIKEINEKNIGGSKIAVAGKICSIFGITITIIMTLWIGAGVFLTHQIINGLM